MVLQGHMAEVAVLEVQQRKVMGGADPEVALTVFHKPVDGRQADIAEARQLQLVGHQLPRLLVIVAEGTFVRNGPYGTLIVLHP